MIWLNTRMSLNPAMTLPIDHRIMLSVNNAFTVDYCYSRRGETTPVNKTTFCTGVSQEGDTPPLDSPAEQRDPMPELKTSQRPLDRMITLRVDAETRSDWQGQAQAADLSLGDWLRSQVATKTGGMHPFPQRKPPPPGRLGISGSNCAHRQTI